jgi:hypothetical protein
MNIREAVDMVRVLTPGATATLLRTTDSMVVRAVCETRLERPIEYYEMLARLDGVTPVTHDPADASCNVARVGRPVQDAPRQGSALARIVPHLGEFRSLREVSDRTGLDMRQVQHVVHHRTGLERYGWRAEWLKPQGERAYLYRIVPKDQAPYGVPGH